MEKNHTPKKPALILYLFLALFAVASCKKDNTVTKTPVTTVTATPTSLGLYKVDSAVYNVLEMDVMKLGTKTLNYGLVFDTGSGGMVIDANGIIPGSMITSSGFNFTGDSTVVNGITITKQTAIIQYGADAATTESVYGNLAYAAVTFGETDGSVTIKRMPFFLYYKATNAKGISEPEGFFDVFGVNSEYDLTFDNNVTIQSPFSYFDPGTGLTKGFKMPALGAFSYSPNGTYVSNVLSLGLTSADLTSSGYAMTNLTLKSQIGYDDYIPSSITYNGSTFSSDVLFDTGTSPFSYIQDPKGPNSPVQLDNQSVTIATSTGFSYTYTATSTNYLTYVENANTSGADGTILGLSFFIDNSYLLDFTDHILGVKNGR